MLQKQKQIINPQFRFLEKLSIYWNNINLLKYITI